MKVRAKSRRYPKTGYRLIVTAERLVPLFWAPAALLIDGKDRSETLHTLAWLGTNTHP